MNLKDFLEHHGLRNNPFAEEDAQTDVVFREHCIEGTFHPAWDKVIGSPSAPSTSIVFGAKGSGKTAMRLQLDRNLRQYNREHPGQRVFVIHYDDFNGWIGQLQTRLGRGKSAKPERVLQQVGIHDHMDALLVQGVTELIDQILQTTGTSSAAEFAVPRSDVDKLDKDQRHDLLLLAACYDQSKIGNTRERWNGLRRTLHVRSWWSQVDWVVAWVGSVIGVLSAVALCGTIPIARIRVRCGDPCDPDFKCTLPLAACDVLQPRLEGRAQLPRSSAECRGTGWSVFATALVCMVF